MNTKPCQLPYDGAPLTVADIIKERVNWEDRFLAHSEARQSVVPPSKAIPKLKYTDTGANWARANVFRRAVSIMTP